MNRLAARPDLSRHRYRQRALGGAGAALILALALGACSSSDSSAAGSGTSATPSSGSTGQTQPTVLPNGAHVTFHGKVQVTGALRFAATFIDKDTAVASCADASAKGDAADGTFTVPSPAAGQNPQIDVTLAHFHGVGTYTPSQMQVDKSDSIWLKSGGQKNEYVLTAHPATPIPGQTMGKEVLFVTKDGAGELAFSEAHKLGQKSGPAIAGLISWTCSK